jgi:hypothetical protein
MAATPKPPANTTRKNVFVFIMISKFRVMDSARFETTVDRVDEGPKVADTRTYRAFRRAVRSHPGAAIGGQVGR